MRTLMGHLAQFASFSVQGEVLCTQGLAYLLQDPTARSAFATDIAQRTGVDIGSDKIWRAEAYQEHDAGRPDLEACADDGLPVVKIEAKLGAALSADQVRSYAADLRRRSSDSALLVLVPRHRTTEATALLAEAFTLSGSGPWRPASYPTMAVAVVTWDDVFDAIRPTESMSFQSDLAQLESMCNVLSGYDIAPLASCDEIVAWRDREGDFVNLVDRASRRLTADPRVAPLGSEPIEQATEGLEPKGYYRRYVCLPLGEDKPCLSIGVRDPFAGGATPIWLRFHKDTALFPLIRSRLLSSTLAPQFVQSSGHVWYPLQVPLDADAHEMVDALVAEANEIVRIAYEPLPGSVTSTSTDSPEQVASRRGPDGVPPSDNVMRVVSWNMAYWKPGGYKAIANRRRQWSYLMALSPDIALLQECRPTDLGKHLPAWADEEYEVLGDIPERWGACSAIVARRGLKPRYVHWTDDDDLAKPEARWLAFLAGYVARAEVTVPGYGPLRIASVHTIANEVEEPEAVSEDDHERTRRSAVKRAWYNDVGAAALRPWVGDRFLVGGDWNTAREFDSRYVEWGDAGVEFFERMERWGWAETLRHSYPEETQTYLDPGSYPYELDHLFTDRRLHDRLVSCKVIKPAALAEMSDHAPIVADYDLGAE